MSNGNNKNSSENPVFDQVEKESERQSGYVKLQAGEERTFRFNPDKIELVDNEFNGKKTKRVEYKVTDPDNEDDEGEKTLSMAITFAKRINRYLRKGRNLLEIERIGSGLDTDYQISTAH